MNNYGLSNISLKDFREFLTNACCKNLGINAGHEKWTRKDLSRPIIIQTHINPIPEFIVKNTLRNLGLNRKDFFDILYANEAAIQRLKQELEKK
jgi:hypothetical protein